MLWLQMLSTPTATCEPVLHLLQHLSFRQTKPVLVDLHKLHQPTLLPEQPPFYEVIKITEPPWHEAETSDAEECVEDLTINFDPDAAWAVDVVTVWATHGWRGVAEQEEQHPTPGDDIKHVYCDEESPINNIS